MRSIILILLSCFLIIGCSQKSKNIKSVYSQPQGGSSSISKTVPEFSVFKENKTGKKIGTEEIEEENIAKSEEIEESNVNREINIKNFKLRDIHFDFDSYIIKPQDIPYLEQLAEFLQKNKEYKLIIEGHCDERGSEMYNLALGQRRANAVKKFLINLGIEKERIETISYGEEKPIEPGHNEEAWAKNRRCHFEIIKK